MRIVCVVASMVGLLLISSGCNDSSEAPLTSFASVSDSKLVPLQETPAFRNLGKRGESKL